MSIIILLGLGLIAMSSCNAQTTPLTMNCSLGVIDLVFVQDQSGSIGLGNFGQCLSFIASMTRSVPIDNTNGRVGFVKFDGMGSVSFYLDSYSRNVDVADAIIGQNYSAGETNIADGMLAAINQVFVPEHGDRPDVVNVMVLITDGTDNSNVAAAHQLALAKNIITFALGVGNDVNRNQLIDATGDASKVYMAFDFDAVYGILSTVCTHIASSIAPPQTTVVWTSEISTAPPVNGQNLPRECPCTFKSLWLDIVIVLDSSSAVTLQDFNGLKASLAGLILEMNIGQTEGQFVRLAFVNYAANATIVSGLTTYNSKDEAYTDLMAIPYLNQVQLNMGAALAAVEKVFQSGGDRSNARNVVIFTSSGSINCPVNTSRSDRAENTDPCQAAANLKQSGAVIITVSLFFDNDGQSPIVGLGSPCYNYTNDIDMISNLVDASCRANCFCLPPHRQFETEGTCHVYGECLVFVEIPATWRNAQISCADTYNSSSLADEFSDEKHAYMRATVFAAGGANVDRFVPYWIGLTANNGNFEWQQYGASARTMRSEDYANWFSPPGVAPTNLANGSCFANEKNGGFNLRWRNAECNNFVRTKYYFCQKPTCDTDNYCAF